MAIHWYAMNMWNQITKTVVFNYSEDPDYGKPYGKSRSDSPWRKYGATFVRSKTNSRSCNHRESWFSDCRES